MVMSALRKGTSGGFLKYILFGLLALAGGGLIFSDIGGFFRDGGVARNDVAKIGNETISIQQFDAQARRTLQQFNMTPQQAYQNGYLNNILSAEVRSRLLNAHAAKSGVVVGTGPVAAQVRDMLAPMIKPGDNPADLLKQLLTAQGLSEHDLKQTLSREMSVEILSEAITSGFTVPSTVMIEDLGKFEKEARNIEYIPFMSDSFKDAQPATEDDLQKMYAATKEAYAIPEMREGQLILINMNDVSEQIEVSAEEIQGTYDRNIASYTESETRVIEQALVAGADQAQKIVEKIKAGESLKAAVKAITKNTTDYIAPQKTDIKSLPEDQRTLVFEAKAGDIIGPLSSALGERIIIVQSIHPEKVQPFESVKNSIAEELKETKKIDAQYDLANAIDDLLAGGASIEELKQHADIEVKNLPAVNAGGNDQNGKPVLTAYKEDAAKILESLFTLNEGESSPVFEYKDGRMASLSLKTLTPKSYKPIEEVKDILAAQWLEDSKRTGNKLEVLKIIGEIEAEGLSLKDVAQKYKKQTQSLAGIVRTSAPPKPFGASAINSIFQAKKDQIIAIDFEGGSALARVTSIKDDGTYTPEEKEKAKKSIAQSFQNEAYAIYIEAQNKRYGAAINDALLKQAYGAAQQEQ